MPFRLVVAPLSIMCRLFFVYWYAESTTSYLVRTNGLLIYDWYSLTDPTSSLNTLIHIYILHFSLVYPLPLSTCLSNGVSNNQEYHTKALCHTHKLTSITYKKIITIMNNTLNISARSRRKRGWERESESTSPCSYLSAFLPPLPFDY